MPRYGAFQPLDMNINLVDDVAVVRVGEPGATLISVIARGSRRHLGYVICTNCLCSGRLPTSLRYLIGDTPSLIAATYKP